MRSLLFAAAALFSINTYACPDLSGTYLCTDDDGDSETMVVTQRVENGVTIYSIGGDDLTTDGNERVEEEIDGPVRLVVKYTGTCSGDQSVNFDFVMDFFYEGSQLMRVKGDAKYSADANGFNIDGEQVTTDFSTGRTSTERINENCPRI